MIPIYDAIKAALIERGWGIDANAKERKDGELHEFIHPITKISYAWLDAVFKQQDIEGEQDSDLGEG